jgi:hypothetical protein
MEMKKRLALLATLFIALLIAGCTSDSASVPTEDPPLPEETEEVPCNVVNSLADMEVPPEGTVTLRSALDCVGEGEPITFDPSLDGGTIELSIVGEEHTMLKGEVMGIRYEPSGPVSYLVGYFERDYGRSALYAQKDVVIDASSLPSGITIAWTGGEGNPARVLAVYGNLTMNNVSVTGGWSVAEALVPSQDDCNQAVTDEPMFQCSTRARGAGLAVWGVARLVNCMLYDNHCKREADGSVPARSRDAGVFGGGIYADIVDLDKCVVSGNSLSASGVSGGGVFSVGGADAAETVSTIDQCAITGNGIDGILGYGAGVYSDGGGIGNRKTLALTNCTIAKNLVSAWPDLSSIQLRFSYWRGGGVYMSNGYMDIHGCTIVENEVYGVPRTDSLDKPNLAGGVAATIGNAHAVEDMTIGHSVIAGNMVYEVNVSGDPVSSYGHDIFTGSLLYFNSKGYNRIGVIDFSQILVPVGEKDWASLCRRHYPKEGDVDGVNVADVLNLASGITYSDFILSAGVDAGNFVVLHYDPQGSALDEVPTSSYIVNEFFAEYEVADGGTDNFLATVLARIEDYYDDTFPGMTDFASDFTTAFETFLQNVDLDPDTGGLQPYTDPDGIPILTLAQTLWFGPAVTWPKELPNHPYIHFWHHLDVALLAEGIGLGPEVLGDAEWDVLFDDGDIPLTDITMDVWTFPTSGFALLPVDQVGTERPANTLGDIGAIEIP